MGRDVAFETDLDKRIPRQVCSEHVLGRGPVWRGSSVPMRAKRWSPLTALVNRLRTEDARHIETNEVGKAIWDLCNGERTIDDIVETLRGAFDGDACQIQADVLHAIRIFADAELLLSPDDSASLGTRCVDLREIPIFVINSEDRPDRRAFMQRQMEELELRFSFVDAIRLPRPGRGCAKSHLSIIGRPNLETPFLVLEDDCEFTDRLPYGFVLPKEADVLYLGASGFGLVPPGTIGRAAWKGVRFTRFGAGYLRVLNMLSGHARLYLSEPYRQVVKEKAEVLCELGHRMDIVQASLHLSHLVLTPVQPMCHQKRELGGQHQATCQSLLALDAE